VIIVAVGTPEKVFEMPTLSMLKVEVAAGTSEKVFEMPTLSMLKEEVGTTEAESKGVGVMGTEGVGTV
jgi:hypothetical protein